MVAAIEPGCECTGPACEWCRDMEREAVRLGKAQPAGDLDALAQRLAWLHGVDAAVMLRQLEDRAAECADGDEFADLMTGLAAMVRDGEARELAAVLTDADIAF